jgi:uncharacterized protein YggE
VVADGLGELLDVAKALGIADDDTKTVGYRIDPQYAYEQGKAPRLVGFAGSQQIALTVRGTDRVGKALDALVGDDAGATAAVAFTLLDRKAAEASAREQAIRDARAKAEAMARTSGVQLGKVLSVNDIGLAPMLDGAAFAPMAKVAAVPAPQLPTGELQVVVRVQVQFELA